MISKKYLSVLLEGLDKNQKYKMIIFALFILIITFLESFGLGMFYPFLQSITNNEMHPTINEFYSMVQLTLNINLDIQTLSILIVAIIIVTKNIFSFFFEYWQITFFNNLRLNLRNKVLKSHFNRDYEVSSNIKMSTYVRDFESTIETYVQSFTSMIQFFIELAIFISADDISPSAPETSIMNSTKPKELASVVIFLNFLSCVSSISSPDFADSNESFKVLFM